VGAYGKLNCQPAQMCNSSQFLIVKRQPPLRQTCVVGCAIFFNWSFVTMLKRTQICSRAKRQALAAKGLRVGFALLHVLALCVGFF